jgi:hypothetical protein
MFVIQQLSPLCIFEIRNPIEKGVFVALPSPRSHGGGTGWATMHLAHPKRLCSILLLLFIGSLLMET